jgi:hypothetical protein
MSLCLARRASKDLFLWRGGRKFRAGLKVHLHRHKCASGPLYTGIVGRTDTPFFFWFSEGSTGSPKGEIAKKKSNKEGLRELH